MKSSGAIEVFQQLLTKYWQIHVSWKNKDENHLVDYVAKHTLQCGVGMQIFKKEMESGIGLLLDGYSIV